MSFIGSAWLSAILLFSILTIVPALANIKYIKALRSANKAIKSGNFKVTQKKTYHIDEFTITMDKVIRVAAIEFTYDKNAVLVGYIDPDFGKVRFIGRYATPNTPSVTGSLFYMDPAKIYPAKIGEGINLFLYNMYGKKVESFLEAATDAMRI